MKRVLKTALICTVIMCISCTLEEPGSPKWEVELTIPIADKIYAMEDLVDDSMTVGEATENWVSSNGDTLLFNFADFSDSLERITVEDKLTYEEFDKTMEANVGVRDVNDPGSDTTYFEFEELNALAGQNLPIDEFNIAEEPQATDPYEEYEWAYLDWGDVNLYVTNNLPVPLDTLFIRLANQNPPGIIILETLIADTINPGETDSSTHPLPVGVEMDNIFIVDIWGHSPGSGSPVLIPDDNNITVEIDLTDLGVSRALAHYPNQTFEEDTTYVLEEEDIVRRAIVREGEATYNATNYSELINDVTFILYDFYDADGNHYIDTFRLFPGETYDTTGSLQNYEFRPEIENTTRAQMFADILDTEDPLYQNNTGFVNLHEDDMIYTELHVSELYFSEFEGCLTERTIDIEQDAVVFEDIPEMLEYLLVEQAMVYLELFNVIGADIEVDMTYFAYKDGSLAETFRFEPPVQVPAGRVENPTILSETIFGLEDIVNLMPDSLLPVGEARISGEIDVAEWQWMEGIYLIQAPLWFGVLDTTSYEPEITVIDDGFENPPIEAVLELYLENRIPLNGTAAIIASYDSAQFENYIPEGAIIDTFLCADLPIPDVDIDGFVISAGESTSTAFLNEEQFEMFSSANEDEPLYIKTEITLYPTLNTIVRVRTSDYIKVGASATLTFEIDTGNGN